MDNGRFESYVIRILRSTEYFFPYGHAETGRKVPQLPFLDSNLIIMRTHPVIRVSIHERLLSLNILP